MTHRIAAGRAVATALAALAALATGPAGPAGLVAQPATDIVVIEIMHRSGHVMAVGAPIRMTNRAGYDNQPVFSPDGRALLYTSIRDGQADAYRLELATGRSERLTRTPESEYSPTPIPGQDRFSVVRVEADSAQRLWSFDLDGGDPRLVLPAVEPVGYHAWIDDEWLALFVLGDPPTLRIARVSTGTARTTAERIGRSVQTVPGRRAFSYAQEREGAWWIRVTDLDSRTDRAVARMPAPDGFHAWTPDGALLTAHGTRILQWHDEGTGRWRTVADLAENDLGTATRLAVSPDGRRLAVVINREDDEAPDGP